MADATYEVPKKPDEQQDVGGVTALIEGLRQDPQLGRPNPSAAEKLEKDGVLPTIPGFEKITPGGTMFGGTPEELGYRFKFNGKVYHPEGKLGSPDATGYCDLGQNKIVDKDGKVLIDGSKVNGLKYNPTDGSIKFEKNGLHILIDTTHGTTVAERGNNRITRDANGNRTYEEKGKDGRFHLTGFRPAGGSKYEIATEPKEPAHPEKGDKIVSIKGGPGGKVELKSTDPKDELTIKDGQAQLIQQREVGSIAGPVAYESTTTLDLKSGKKVEAITGKLNDAGVAEDHEITTFPGGAQVTKTKLSADPFFTKGELKVGDKKVADIKCEDNFIVSVEIKGDPPTKLKAANGDIAINDKGFRQTGIDGTKHEYRIAAGNVYHVHSANVAGKDTIISVRGPELKHGLQSKDGEIKVNDNGIISQTAKDNHSRTVYVPGRGSYKVQGDFSNPAAETITSVTKMDDSGKLIGDPFKSDGGKLSFDKDGNLIKQIGDRSLAYDKDIKLNEIKGSDGKTIEKIGGDVKLLEYKNNKVIAGLTDGKFRVTNPDGSKIQYKDTNIPDSPNKVREITPLGADDKEKPGAPTYKMTVDDNGNIKAGSEVLRTSLGKTETLKADDQGNFSEKQGDWQTLRNANLDITKVTGKLNGKDNQTIAELSKNVIAINIDSVDSKGRITARLDDGQTAVIAPYGRVLAQYKETLNGKLATRKFSQPTNCEMTLDNGKPIDVTYDGQNKWTIGHGGKASRTVDGKIPTDAKRTTLEKASIDPMTGAITGQIYRTDKSGNPYSVTVTKNASGKTTRLEVPIMDKDGNQIPGSNEVWSFQLDPQGNPNRNVAQRTLSQPGKPTHTELLIRQPKPDENNQYYYQRYNAKR